MSKLTKLFKHPIQFFLDAGKGKKKAAEKKAIEKKIAAAEKKAVAAEKKAAAAEKKAVAAEKKAAAAEKKAAEKKAAADKKETETKGTKTMLASIIKSIIPVSNVNLSHIEIVLYFDGKMGNIYQVQQWIGTLNELHKKKPILIITRVKEVYDWLSAHTDFIVVYCRTINDVIELNEENNFKCILYVNNGAKNFQSLINGRALHVHINHGESDKTSTITNQSKAYDYVFIVGDAAYDKYYLNLIKKDMSKYIKVGRPQLEHIERIPPFDSGYVEIPTVEENSLMSQENAQKVPRKVILYAPTWEGTHESMNFTSLNDFGMAIVQQLLAHPDYYLVYKPHPNTGSRDSLTKKINESIIKLLDKNSKGKAILGGDINSLYEHIDLAIFDNSAVAIDYLLADKPMLMTDMFYKVKDRESKPTIVKAARMITEREMYGIPMIVADELENDNLKDERNKVRRYFLGDFNYAKKESTHKFISTLFDICDERDHLVDNLKKINEDYTIL